MFRCLVVLATAGPAGAGEPSQWIAGAYSFSDELGGFLITGISGIGSKTNPVVIEQEMLSASAVTLIIRARTPIRPYSEAGIYANGMIHMRIRALNNSGIAWTEFEFELQEIFGQPSTFGDGLSFDQRRTSDENRHSNVFAVHNADFEPFDRLLFTDGHVDPLEIADFGFFITDFTPKREFYLRQDPRVPLS